MASQEELRRVARVLEGESGALEKFIADYRPFVYAILTRYLNFSPADADEVFQRFLIHIWENRYQRLRRWSGKGTLQAYIGRIVRNLSHDYRRERLRDSPAEAEDLQADDSDFEDAERSRILAAAIEELSTRDRDLIHRRYYLEQSYGEIAIALGITVNNAGVALHRAEKRLRELLAARL